MDLKLKTAKIAKPPKMGDLYQFLYKALVGKEKVMSRITKHFLFMLIFSGYILGFSPSSKIIPWTGATGNKNYGLSDFQISEPDGFENSQDHPSVEEELRRDAEIQAFKEKIFNGESEEIRGIFADNNFSFFVVNQPASSPAYVSSIQGVVTNFKMAEKHNVIGLIAHNYLAGKEFFFLKRGDVVRIIYGDGAIISYEIKEIQRFQALSPNSPYSEFRNLDSSDVVSATDLFNQVYSGKHHLTLQTCIQKGDEDSWGRLFLIGEPI